MQLGFLMLGSPERLVLQKLQGDIHALRPDQIKHVEHLLRSWRVPQGMLWEPAVSCIRKAIARVKRDRP